MNILIVVPTLNSFGLLPRLLHSLQSQRWPHWRLLFVDGPSVQQHRQWLEDCCEAEPRCSWLVQASDQPGIFGAMNHGFSCAGPDEWLMFWGSDDLAASPTVLAEVAIVLERNAANRFEVDLLICSARYANPRNLSLGRPSVFQPACVLDVIHYRRALLLGSTPPHQATLFGPGARNRLAGYAPGFRLSADLDYFLQLSHQPDLCVQCLDLELVHITSGGISGQQTQRRLQEVCSAYHHTFGWLWWLPFVIRYLRRIASLATWIR